MVSDARKTILFHRFVYSDGQNLEIFFPVVRPKKNTTTQKKKGFGRVERTNGVARSPITYFR